MSQTEILVRDTADSLIDAKVKRVFFDIVNSVKGGSGKSTISLLLAAYCNSDAYYNYNPKPRDSKGESHNSEEVMDHEEKTRLVQEVIGHEEGIGHDEVEHRDNEDKQKDNRLKRRAEAYILDLDLKGTSWEKNYGNFITTQYYDPQDNETLHAYFADAMESHISSPETKKHKIRYRRYPFFNTLMNDYKSFRTKLFWSDISFQVRTNSQTMPVRKIKICPSYSINSEKINKIEVDIFENTLQQLIFDILNTHLMDSCSVTDTENIADDVHIILDMPPSYEEHAEQVIKHLLTNSNSELYQKAQNEEGPFKKNPQNNYFKPYIVNFFMPCSVSNAHIEQNGIYLWNWFQNVHYSDCVFAMMKKSRIRFRFIINDISDYYSDINQQFGKSLDAWTNEIIEELQNGGVSLYYNKAQEELRKRSGMSGKQPFEKVRIMKHMKLPGAASLFHPASSIPPGPVLPIDIDYLNAIENVAADLFLEEENDGA